MNKQRTKTYIIYIIGAVLVGIIGGVFAYGGMENYDMAIKPGFAPPDTVFPIVWTILYILMGYGAATISLTKSSNLKKLCLDLYRTQLTISLIWPILFFTKSAYRFSFVIAVLLTISVASLIYFYQKLSKKAAWSQALYLIWLVFATVLNYAVWQLN